LDKHEFHAILYESLETELGGVLIYEAALRCAINEDLIGEWGRYLSQTRNHVRILTRTLISLGLDPEHETPGRNIARMTGRYLIKTIETASFGGRAVAAQIVAAECVVLCETKDRMNWQLISAASQFLEGNERSALKAAVAEVEAEENEHLLHCSNWARELRMASLGLATHFPPAEETEEAASRDEHTA